MVYVTFMDACLDENHDECLGKENTPAQVDGKDVVCGGGHCICHCHYDDSTDLNFKWRLEVKKNAITSRKIKLERQILELKAKIVEYEHALAKEISCSCGRDFNKYCIVCDNDE